MELKEAILSTLAELQEDGGDIGNIQEATVASETHQSSYTARQEESQMPNFEEPIRRESPAMPLHNLSSVELDATEVLGAIIKKEPPLMPMAQESMEVEMVKHSTITPVSEGHTPSVSESDRKFLEGLRERILVMFEGMQSPNNRAPEAKIDLVLNFFEWQLALIDERLEGKNR